MTKLVIVESPGKIKKIKSYLGPGYIVMASIGHIRDLAKDSLSIDVEHNFEPTYEIMQDKKKVVSDLKKMAKTVDNIIIASDGDREGEAIAYHLVNVLNINEYDRIVFHEITKNAINEALKDPKKIDMNMFYSQQTRRLLDRIVGFKLSPILKSIPELTSSNLGAGRVQSVVTKIIVDKENDIKEFISSEKGSIYNISGNFDINDNKIKANYIEYDSKTDKKLKSEITTKEQVKIIATKISNHPQFNIIKISSNERQRNPPQPFVTSTLQQETSYKLHYPIKKTMMLAQKLYEKGHITYMRTDSPTLSNEALSSIKKQILEDSALGETYYQFRQFKAKGANAQEAHEAIRPTHFDIFNFDDELSGSDEEKLYKLIWNRTVASQMKPAKYQDQHIILANSKNIVFECVNSMMTFDGYLKLYKETTEEDEQEVKHIKLDAKKLENNKVSWTEINFKETYSNPPSRFNEPSLVKKLEELSIGRPSTYAAIISKIQEHNYVKVANNDGIEKKVIHYTLISNKFTKSEQIQKIGGDKGKLVPTSDGITVTNYLNTNFPEIMDYQFTSHMELLLDEIAEGKKIWYNVLQEFYDILKKEFNKLDIDIDKKYIIQKQNNGEKQKIEKTIIGQHPKYGDIEYMIAKFGPVFKINIGKKCTFINASNIDINSKDIEKESVECINKKLEYIQKGGYKKTNKKYVKKTRSDDDD